MSEEDVGEMERVHVKSAEEIREESRKYRSKWLCHNIEGPLWPTEGDSRGNDVY